MRAAVLIAKESCYEHVFAAAPDPLKKLVDTFVEQGGKIWKTGMSDSESN